MSLQVSKRIDARGSQCPGPLMELVRAVKKAEVGEIIEVLSNDPGSVKDIPEWVKRSGHELLEIKEYGDYRGFIVKKGESRRRRKKKE